MSSTSSTVTSPAAPGQLGMAVPVISLQTYLGQLQEWLTGRRQELDALDAAARESSGTRHDPTADIALSMALWNAVRQRHEQLLGTWDSGRVGETERLTMSSLIWGRLDTATPQGGGSLSGMNLSLPEACRLSDALAASLRTRLSLAPNADVLAGRLRDAAAQVERLREQVSLEPAAERAGLQARVSALAERWSRMSDKASRGGDIGGWLAPFEQEASTLERDLIVGNARRRKQQARRDEVAAEQRQLAARQREVEALVADTAALVHPSPKYAVADVGALGDIPSDPAALEAHAITLGRVARSFDVLEQAHRQARREADGAMERLAVVQRVAERSPSPAVADLLAVARQHAEARPMPIAVVRSLVEALEALVVGHEV